MKNFKLSILLLIIGIQGYFNVSANYVQDVDYSYIFDSQDKITNLASKIKLVVLDVDGVLTDGSFTYDENGHTRVNFHVHDFVGLLLGKNAGIVFAVITAGDNPTTEVLVKKIGIKYYFTKRLNKFKTLQEILKETEFNLDEVAFIGDDWVDETIMLQVGLPMSVPNAMPEILKIAKWVSQNPGGQGAVREAIHFILKSQNKLNNIFR